MYRLIRIVAALFVAAVLVMPTVGFAGTTGGLVGRVVDVITGKPLAGARVSAASPTQSASSTTDANGSFRFLSLVPDTYFVSVEAPGYQTKTTYATATVLADQVQQLSFSATPQLRQIGSVRTRASSDYVKAGTTSDVYSVSGAAAEATMALGGPGGLSSAYGQIASVPGAVVQQGQQGWYQTVSIRGGDIDQVGYELDGIPVNRPYDNAPQTVLSALGQQELQVYTGGIPASADASSISGYVNQVIKSGTRPGFGNFQVALGGPSFYNKTLIEAGGATPDRRFTYYGGFAAVGQAYRYVDNKNGAGDAALFFPVNIPTGAGNFFPAIHDGSQSATNPLLFAGGQNYAISDTQDREAVANLHYALPHRFDSGRDDLQFLALDSRIVARFYSSINDQGGAAALAAAGIGINGHASWNDGVIYNGALGAAANPALIAPYYFQGSTRSGLTDNTRDQTDNSVTLAKLQWQRNINDRSYLRLYGYAMYSNWLISGPANQDFTSYGSNSGSNGFGAELNDYELPAHTFGANLQYLNQLSDKHTLTFTASQQRSAIERRYNYAYPGNSFGRVFAELLPSGANQFSGSCYDAATLAGVSCFSTGGTGARRFSDVLANGLPTAPAGFSWIAADGAYNNRLNRVSPIFSSLSLTDAWRPSQKIYINAGLRVERYDDRLGALSSDPIRQFWLNAYNNEYCFKVGFPQVVRVGPPAPGTTNAANCSALNATAPYGVPGTSWQPANLSLAGGSGGSLTSTFLQPRFGMTYTINGDTVLRGSYGIYSRAVNTSWLQYDVTEPNLASYLGPNFLGLGYSTPVHNLRPDVSYNGDLSLEQHLSGTDVSYKLTPYLRRTRDQLQPFPLGPGGVVTGANVGRQSSYGVEFALRKGDAARDGISWQLAYTYTNSKIKYANFAGGTNVIDTLNAYIQEYNSYTAGCAAITSANKNLCGGQSANAVATMTSTDAKGNPIAITNPYFGATAQPLLDRDANYTTYDQIPTPFFNGTGYETPHVLSGYVNYRRGRFGFTPSATYSSGASYGNPLSVPGIVPNGCTAHVSVGSDPNAALPASCFGAGQTTGAPYLVVPNPYTGRFDTLGAFKQPARLTLNLSSSYDLSARTKAVITFTGLLDKCYQRGYAWDDSNVCVYSNLSGFGGVAPSFAGYPGSFLTSASQNVPQLRYPYGVFSNNLNTGFLGTKLPLQATFEMRFKL